MWKSRWKRCCAALVLISGSMMTGCEHLSGGEKGALAGGGLGAVTGALISKATGNKAGVGAVASGAIGAISGALIGDSQEQTRRYADQQLAQAQAMNPTTVHGDMSLNGIIGMSNQGLTDATIINQIHSRGVRYNLSSYDVTHLKQHGVSERVIQAMQNTALSPATHVQPHTRTRTIIYDRRPVYVAPPPPRVGFGISYSSRGRRCR